MISKLIEIIIHEQTQKYLSNQNILFKYLSGFRTNHSTDTCLSYLNDKILSGFDQGKTTGMILIYLQKAFDTIDHKVILGKLVYIVFWTHLFHGSMFILNAKNDYSDPGVAI